MDVFSNEKHENQVFNWLRKEVANFLTVGNLSRRTQYVKTPALMAVSAGGILQPINVGNNNNLAQVESHASALKQFIYKNIKTRLLAG